MLIDLLSMDNYVNFNIQFAQILGLHTAIYLSELLNINEKAVRKNKVKDNFFTIDRKYIKDRTTLEVTEQKEIDACLLGLGILKQDKENMDTLTLDLTVLASLVSSEPTTIKDLQKIVKNAMPKKRTKAAAIADNLKAKVDVKNPELYELYCQWIDTVIHKQGWMSVTSVTTAPQVLDAYCDHNLDLALEIMKIASLNGYRDIQWAINSYESEHKVSYKPSKPVTNREQIRVSSEVF